MALRRHAVKARGIEGLHADLVGRDEELARLRTALAQTLSHNGQIVAVVGEAGVGKSRLVADLKRWSAQQYEITESAAGTENMSDTLLWLEGRGLEYTNTVSYSLFADLCRGFWRASTVDNQDLLAENLRATLQTLQQGGYLAVDMVEEIGSLLGRLLALHFGDAWDERLRHIDPNQLHQRTLVAAKALFVALARQQPLVLVFEDLVPVGVVRMAWSSIVRMSATCAPGISPHRACITRLPAIGWYKQPAPQHILIARQLGASCCGRTNGTIYGSTGANGDRPAWRYKAVSIVAK